MRRGCNTWKDRELSGSHRNIGIPMVGARARARARARVRVRVKVRSAVSAGTGPSGFYK